jgi:hypothetical protein
MEMLLAFAPGLLIVAFVVIVVFGSFGLLPGQRKRTPEPTHPKWMSWRCRKCCAVSSPFLQIFHKLTFKDAGPNGLDWLEISCWRCGYWEFLGPEDRRSTRMDAIEEERNARAGNQ